MNAAKTERATLDFYPTPAPAVAVLRDWLAAQPHAPGDTDAFLDPAAGDGHIVHAMRDVWGESFWHALEIDGARIGALEDCAENPVAADALFAEWPAAHVVANPPFRLLDDFWEKISRHRERHLVWCAAFTPCAWWHAEKRSRIVRPDYLLALGWRPVFRGQSGPGHKGSQDFVWAVLAPEARPLTVWSRHEKPRAA